MEANKGGNSYHPLGLDGGVIYSWNVHSHSESSFFGIKTGFLLLRDLDCVSFWLCKHVEATSKDINEEGRQFLWVDGKRKQDLCSSSPPPGARWLKPNSNYTLLKMVVNDGRDYSLTQFDPHLRGKCFGVWINLYIEHKAKKYIAEFRQPREKNNSMNESPLVESRTWLEVTVLEYNTSLHKEITKCFSKVQGKKEASYVNPNPNAEFGVIVQYFLWW